MNCAHRSAVFFKKKYLLLLEEKINYYVKALCVLIFRIRFVFSEAFIIAYASLPKLQTLRFADYSSIYFLLIHSDIFFYASKGRSMLIPFFEQDRGSGAQAYTRFVRKILPEE